jgi:hypothetical protein
MKYKPSVSKEFFTNPLELGKDLEQVYRGNLDPVLGRSTPLPCAGPSFSEQPHSSRSITDCRECLANVAAHYWAKTLVM